MDTLSAKEILSTMLKRYAECFTYSDSGFLKVIGERHSKKLFKTFFVRPNLFRFEWTDCHPFLGPKAGVDHHCIWSDGERAYKRYPYDNCQIKQTDNLSLAVAGATGISSGLAHVIYSLLLPNEADRRNSLVDLRNVEVRKTKVVAGVPCHHLHGVSRSGGDVELWIAKEGFNLVKIKEHVVVTAAFQEETLDALWFEGSETAASVNKFSDKQHVDETRYESVSFDSPIALDVFSPRFEQESVI